jgi:hypothetical protein
MPPKTKPRTADDEGFEAPATRPPRPDSEPPDEEDEAGAPTAAVQNPEPTPAPDDGVDRRHREILKPFEKQIAALASLHREADGQVRDWSRVMLSTGLKEEALRRLESASTPDEVLALIDRLASIEMLLQNSQITGHVRRVFDSRTQEISAPVVAAAEVLVGQIREAIEKGLAEALESEARFIGGPRTATARTPIAASFESVRARLIEAAACVAVSAGRRGACQIDALLAFLQPANQLAR